jgi:uncharacterized protein
MDNYINKKDVFSGIRPIVASFAHRYSQIQAVYLFGSVALEKASTSSDIDIAVRFSPDQPPEFCLRFRFELAGEIENITGKKVDVVILNSASLSMIRQVLSHGILLYSKSREEEIEFVVAKRREYFDFRYYLDRDRDTLKSFYGV